MDSDASSHMTEMTSMILSVSETDSGYYMSCGARSMHGVKGVGIVVFQLESRGSLEVARVIYATSYVQSCMHFPIILILLNQLTMLN